MQRFTLKTGLIYIISFILIFVVTSFFYSLINNKFHEQKAADNLQYVNRKIAFALESSLKHDYNRLKLEIDTSEEIDKITYLRNNKENLMLSNTIYSGFGYGYDDHYIINDDAYDFTLDFIASNYKDYKISIFTFSNAFNDNIDNNLYIVFKVGDIIAYFDAELYLKPIFEDVDSFFNNYYFIVTQDGYIKYQKNNDTLNNKLYDHYIRGDNNKNVLDQINNDLYGNKGNTVRLNIFEEPSFLSYTPIFVSEGFTDMNIFVVHSFSKQELMGTMVSLNVTLIIFFAILFTFLVVSIISIHFVLHSKFNDIELSRLVHYYTKPYIIKLNRHGKIVYFNQTIKYSIKDYDKLKTVYDLRLEKEDSDLLFKIKKQIPFTVIFKSSNDMIYIRFIPLKSGFGFYLLGENVTQREQEFIYNRNMALFNKVTKLPNLNYLTIKLKELFDNKEQLKHNNSIVSIDVSGFKNINSVFGQRIGDETLIAIAQRIRESLEGFSSMIFNTEVDIFVIIIENLESYKQIEKWVEDFIDQMMKPIEIEKNFLEVPIKVGIFNIEKEKYEDLNPIMGYENSIMALKKAKMSRRIDYAIYDSRLGQYISRDQLMEIDLIKAIKDNEFMMFLQPMYDNQEGKIVGCEALIRWNNPKYFLESPAHFIELAEQNNLIIEIGRFVIDETFKIAKTLEKFNLEISINISPIQILQAGFVNEITKAFERHQLKRNSISIEITETFLMTTFDMVNEKLKLLRNHGFNIHLDDFGTGYSSMLYLKDLPIDTIKIDKEFIANINTDRYARAIVSKIISLAKTLELGIIAEGVEDEKQNQFLIRNGCNVIQGHLISKAISVENVVKLIEDFNSTNKKPTKTKK